MKKTGLSEMARRIGEPSISWMMKLTLSRPKLISLAAGFTDNESLPVEATRELLGELLASPKTARPALQYGTTIGDPRLRELTVRRLQCQDRVASKAAYAADRTLITSGSQQLLYLTGEVLLDPGDIVLLEDPTYFVFLGITETRGAECRGIRMESDGIDLAHLEATLESLKRSGALRRVKMLYLVTYFQNPTGRSTSHEKKAGALQLLRRYEKHAGHPIYLLEDGAYRDLRFAGRDIKSALADRDGTERVIYTGTFSKPFASGARVAFGILPDPLYRAAVRLKGNHDFGTANLLQQLMLAALTSGKFDTHLAGLQMRYRDKAEVMMNAARDHFPSAVEWEKPEGGLYIWARVPRSAKTGVKSNIFQKALKSDVVYVPGELCYAPDPTRRRPNREMRLSFGGATETDIREGIRRLGAALQRELKQ